MRSLRSLLMLGALVAGCNETITRPPDGRVEIDVQFTGDDVDADGIQVALGGEVRDVTSNVALVFSRLPTGLYTLALIGVAEQCTTTGVANPQVQVRNGVTTSLS